MSLVQWRFHSKSNITLAVGCLLMLQIFLAVPSQAQNIQWARQYGTTRVESGNSISTMEGNVYVVGDTIGVLPGQTNDNLNDRDAFVSRFDTLGNLTWTRQFGASPAAEDVATGAAADGSGGYVVGWTRGTLPQQVRADGSDAFIRKYDAAGAEVWTRQFGTVADDEALAVVSHTSGVYVVGVVKCCAANLTPGLPAVGGSDAFIRKYDGNGNHLWTRQFGTGDADSATGVAVDGSGVYVTGNTGGALAGPSGLTDGYLRKFNHDGAVVWTQQYGTTTQNEDSHAVAVSSSGVYVGGKTTGTFASQAKVGGLWDSFVIKYNLDGVSQWVRQFGGVGDGDDVYGLAVGGELILVTGAAEGPLPGQTFVGGVDAFIRLYDPSGNELGTRQFGNGGNDYGTGATADLSGFYVSGTKLGAALDLTPGGDNDIFVLKVIPPPVVPDRAVVNAASFATTAVVLPPPPLAPGSMAVVFGSYLNDGSNSLSTSLGADGKVITSLGGTQVRVDNVLAPILYSTPGQVAIQIPFEVAGQTTASLVVAVAGQSSAPRIISIAPAAPGFFTINQAGSGPAVALHDDGITLITPGNPARTNEVVVFYLTGLGALNPALPTGVPAGANTAVAAVTLTIGGAAAVIEYAGAAPGFIGLNQINARIPANVSPGANVSVQLSIGGRSSNQVTMPIGQ